MADFRVWYWRYHASYYDPAVPTSGVDVRIDGVEQRHDSQRRDVIDVWGVSSDPPDENLLDFIEFVTGLRPIEIDEKHEHRFTWTDLDAAGLLWYRCVDVSDVHVGCGVTHPSIGPEPPSEEPPPEVPE